MIIQKRMFMPFVLTVCVFSLSAAYAATSGVMTFTGTAIVSPSANVVFKDVKFNNTTLPGDTVSLINNDQTITFTITIDPFILTFPTIICKVQNIGPVPVQLGSFVDKTPDTPGLRVAYPYFGNLVLQPGDTTITGAMTILPDYDEMPPLGTTYTLMAELTYTEVAA